VLIRLDVDAFPARRLDGRPIEGDSPAMRFVGRAAALALLLGLGARAGADDCATLLALTNEFASARATIADARTALDAMSDVVAPLALAHGAIEVAQTDLAAATSPVALLKRRRSMRARLNSALHYVVASERHPTRTRAVTRWLRAADRYAASAATVLDRAAAPFACGVELNGPLGAEEIFPADNWWNVDVSSRATLANSGAIIDFIGRTKPMHADFGTTFGIPYVVLDAPQPLTPLTFLYDDESDHAAPGHAPGYPIPAATKTVAGYIEGGVAGGSSSGDRHLLLVDRTTHFLFEIYAAQWTGAKWTAGSGAIFDLTSNARRPDGWTSADAAGLAIFPGLVRADEVFDNGEITHALRFTVRATQGYVYPASHDATHGAGGDLRPPLGLRVRLKADVDLSQMSAPARVVFTAMKKYGLILADNGSDWYVTGATDPRWNDGQMHDDFARITGNDFEAVE
jgi:hypothetical protein